MRGLSPRGRGKPPALPGFPGYARSIPAWAGETFALALARRGMEVYPRVGGGGKPHLFCWTIQSKRSIPAWAGETQIDWFLASIDTVYPRVGGGNGNRSSAGLAERGLSPRGRGKPAPGLAPAKVKGSIPAWAGETICAKRAPSLPWVYPRVGGGNGAGRAGGRNFHGLSPRGRGKHQAGDIDRRPPRSIPAWAGETQNIITRCVRMTVYPRVGGGNWPASWLSPWR